MSPDLKEQIRLELKQLDRLLESFAPLRLKVRQSEPDMTETAALATFLHSFYNGLENIFKRVADSCGERLAEAPFSHSFLLNSMCKPASTRPAVLSKEMNLSLKRYMEFRHLFRHAYTFEFRWRKMAPLVLDSDDVYRSFTEEMECFLTSFSA